MDCYWSFPVGCCCVVLLVVLLCVINSVVTLRLFYRWSCWFAVCGCFCLVFVLRVVLRGCLLIACWMLGGLIVLYMFVVLCFGGLLGFEFYICLHAYCLLVLSVVVGCFLFICGHIVCWFWFGCLALLGLCLM